MSRTLRWLALAAVAVLAPGCALYDTRYDYSRSALPFADYDESILDWNFPTTTNQGLLTPPERLHPWRPAVGVPWANGDLAPWNRQTPISDSASLPSAGSHDGTAACESACVDAPEAPMAPRADADPGVRDHVVRVAQEP
ncbi:MAG TPA: hypothetical protein VFO33_08540 [Casimicrobiaceae bacterium]|nr:hypothetical protein [Casimicrobiaceae bacterium]